MNFFKGICIVMYPQIQIYKTNLHDDEIMKTQWWVINWNVQWHQNIVSYPILLALDEN